MTLQTEILSTETSDFLKQYFFSGHLVHYFICMIQLTEQHDSAPTSCFTVNYLKVKTFLLEQEAPLKRDLKKKRSVLRGAFFL